MINYTTLATTSLAFTLALAWNEAVSKTIRSIYHPGADKEAAHMMFIYALVTTIIVIIVVMVINNCRKLVHRLNGGVGDIATLPSPAPLIKLWTPPTPQSLPVH